jgi:predicted ATPase/class 3 adenylate cyclase/DNA-binding CsgD family transcriptional regulator/Tfp pilus assembly protein PilF
MWTSVRYRRLTIMIKSDAGADTSSLNWGELAVSELPTGTVTLLLADVEGSTRLWETQPDVMTEAVARLDQTLTDSVATHGGVRPVEQGEGDSFVIAFARASDAVACALALQRAPLAPIKLRIGLHTGEIRLRDEGNYIGPTINRTARLRDLAHGGQTVLSGATEPLVVDQLPPDVTLTDLGTHGLRDLPRPERVVQLNHPELSAEFPPLRTANVVASHNVPTQLTSFIGRQKELAEVGQLLTDNRLVTLTGVGGTGKTRLAAQVALEIASEFTDGAWYVDLAPISVPELVPTTVARALGLTDQPGHPTIDTLQRFLSDRELFMVLDNCEHLLESSARLTSELLGGCPGLTLLTTSREPLGVAGEVTWGVPSLSLSDEAIELFDDRARRARPGFHVGADNIDAVTEICRRLDGLPLAIELAAARIRALSVTDIVDSLHDRFRLLTGGARTVVRRQQTLRASVDWSHALLSDSERIMFRHLAVFVGGFDLDAAHAVAGADPTERYQVLDQLTLLVEKSLVVAEDSPRGGRYRLLETVRQYALEKLGEASDVTDVRDRHRDHYAALAATLDTPPDADYERHLSHAESELGNLRAAFGWSLENSKVELALTLTSSLQPMWFTRGRLHEGSGWFDAALAADPEHEIPPTTRARALADNALLEMMSDADASFDQAQSALAIAREADDPALLLRALSVCSFILGVGYDSAAAAPYFAEAIELARALDDRWRLSQILTRLAGAAVMTGDPVTAETAAGEGRELAEAIGDRSGSRECRYYLAWARLAQGETADAVARFSEVVADAEANHDAFLNRAALSGLGTALAYRGEVSAARAEAGKVQDAGVEVSAYFTGLAHMVLSLAALADGDVAAAREASETTWQHLVVVQPHMAVVGRAFNGAVAALADGDLATARRWTDESITLATGWHRALALTIRARIAIASGDPDTAERDVHQAISLKAELSAFAHLPDALECLADVTATGGKGDDAARLFGAAESARLATGMVRYKVYDAWYESSVAGLRTALGQGDFDAAWAKGAALSTEEAIAYAQRGRGERKRPSSGWASLTPSELDVVGLVAEGLTNKDVAARLFVSPRTVQSHLAHVFAKLGVTTRTQLAQEAARHA